MPVTTMSKLSDDIRDGGLAINGDARVVLVQVIGQHVRYLLGLQKAQCKRIGWVGNHQKHTVDIGGNKWLYSAFFASYLIVRSNRHYRIPAGMRCPCNAVQAFGKDRVQQGG